MPRSTMLTGISGSSTSRRASSSSPIAGMTAAEVVELLLELPDHLGVARAASPPTLEHVIPGAGIVEVPAPGLGVEDAWERVVERPHLPSVGWLLVGRHPHADLLAVGHHQRQPPLAQLVVGLALQPVLQLPGMHLQAVREPEPLDR